MGASYDLIKNGYNGFMVKNNKPDELERAIYEILVDDQLRIEMGENSRRLFEEWNDYEKKIEGFMGGIYSLNYHPIVKSNSK
jgi:glycosyltransferase involved in cell wall biosynthesis